MKSIKLFTITALVTMFFLGCAGPGTVIGRPGDKGGSVEDWRLTQRDLHDVALKLTNDLLNSGRLDRTDGKKYVIGIDKIDTSRVAQKVDTSSIPFTISKALNDSGKCYTSVMQTLGQRSELSGLVREAAASDDVREGSKIKRGTQEGTTHSLMFRMVEDTTTRGNKTDKVYRVDMWVNDLNTNVAIWQGQEYLSKSGKGKGRTW